ncbi:MAG: ribosome biogenesis GTPase Der [Deltaproteobacteria bacterium]|nr:MAG: ribosome biogenesis GTPase Der [Deltaproteobacteria bacterium]
MKKIVALFGRPNVGKSTLFNRITKTRNAIVDNKPGVTRDRNYGKAVYDDKSFILVDTGGFLSKDTDSFAKEIKTQLEKAAHESDIIVLVLDGKYGLSSYDYDLLELLRDIQKPKFYIVNKIDGIEKEDLVYDFYSLGIDPVFPVSGEHGYGVNDFLSELSKHLIDDGKSEKNENIIKIALVGRPNAGKSSLANKILGEERMVVSDVPGTTRDSIDSMVKFNAQNYLFIDTAGIRRKGKVNEKIEKFSVIKALKSLEKCDIALILIDCHEGITEQDVKIAGYAEERGCGAIFVLNKWDLVEKDSKSQKKYVDDLRYQAAFLAYAPVITISAKTGKRVHKIFPMINEVYKEYKTRISTSEVNQIIQTSVEKNTPPYHKGKRLKFYYSTQVSTSPPTFVSFVNYPEAVHFSYKRFLVNQIKEYTGLSKTPVILHLRQRSGKEGFSDRFTNKKNKSKLTKKGKNKRLKKRR